jgi:predicted nucleic acid-binding Zn ribbon protein
MEKQKCEICGKPAVAKCAQCGMALCEDHKRHGVQFRTNDPSINCPNCQSNIKRLNNRLVIILGIGLVIISLVLFLYFNSIFQFI